MVMKVHLSKSVKFEQMDNHHSQFMMIQRCDESTEWAFTKWTSSDNIEISPDWNEFASDHDEIKSQVDLLSTLFHRQLPIHPRVIFPFGGLFFDEGPSRAIHPLSLLFH
jgi:hypothetical protein